ncbi:hypothetical protein Q428_07100 [Fervidicella metallireducens AeB]|uniref:Methyltransferase n=1 Tax=Fervidicella metallireducens AeB TaxID=1403537 RepID=A0A017RXH2_9CLOT|nr:site-specific DNA-methyltransferase [Fervidicella metallireducens]EYE88620.1 hypothetical protein Q428_07100 [Fervidicella metallireducens AeB]
MQFYKDENVELILGNCIEKLMDLNEKSVDMIFADPPYRLSNDGITCKSGKFACVNKGEWDRSGGFENDYNFNRKWLEACDRVLKDTGSIWISGTYHIIHTIAFALMELGYHIINEIVWFKPNAAPNMSRRCFTASHEVLIWVKKSKNARHKFNYDFIKEFNGGKQMRSVWEIPTTPKREKTFGAHPTQKPKQLLFRCIMASTDEGDMILDPFCGSGTTGVVAVENKRNFIGIDIEEVYLELTKKRIQQIH